MNRELFVDRETEAALGQYFTPRWVAEAIVERHFSDLARGDTVVEPSCGDGRFLLALPEHVRAVGIEIDPAHAATARARSGREVIVGDFTRVDLRAVLPEPVQAVVGNPPFTASTIARFLERAHDMLEDGGRCGFILPAYVLQTSSKVMDFAKHWSITTELLPRNVFPRLSLPITFTMFRKSTERCMVGFFLYEEAADIATLPTAARVALCEDPRRGSVWRHAVNDAFAAVGLDEMPLDEIYVAIERQRPTGNRHYREKVRQTLQVYPEFASESRGVWRRRPATVPQLLEAA